MTSDHSAQNVDVEALRAIRDGLLSEWRAAYDAVPEDRAVTVDELHVPTWWRGRGQLAHALRRLAATGLLVKEGRGRFRRIPLEGGRG